MQKHDRGDSYFVFGIEREDSYPVVADTSTLVRSAVLYTDTGLSPLSTSRVDKSSLNIPV